MASSLRVSQILPSVGTNVAIGTDTGSVTISGTVTGVSTFSSISATTVSTTRLVGVSTAGITTAYVGSINDGPISGARNRIINGDFRIDQRNAGIASSFSASGDQSSYVLDRWSIIKNTNSKAYTIQRSGITPVGFTSSLLMTVTSTNGSIGSGDYDIIRQFIEGYNVSDLMWGTANARPVTLSFWVRSSVTGTYSISLVIQSQGNYPATYTINSTNTWEYKTITVPGPTSGTWPIDNTIGLGVYFDMGIGSTYSTTTNTWTYGQNVFGGTGVTKLTQTNGATFYITGVQLEAGTVATPFERRSYGQELALCYRYYRRYISSGATYNSIGSGLSNGATAVSRWGFPLDTPMRAAPTVSFTNCVGWNGPVGGAISVAGSYNTTNNIDVDLNTSGLTATQGLIAKVLMLSNGYVELTGAEL